MSRCYSIIHEDGCPVEHRDPAGRCGCDCHDDIHECPGCSNEFTFDSGDLRRIIDDNDDFGGELVCHTCVAEHGLEHRVQP